MHKRMTNHETAALDLTPTECDFVLMMAAIAQARSDRLTEVGEELDAARKRTHLDWKQTDSCAYEATLGTATDGVVFSLIDYPTCYRRGRYRLIVEVLPGPHHHDWGCFDDQDQPVRNYHSLACALHEANMIADVLLRDRRKNG